MMLGCGCLFAKKQNLSLDLNLSRDADLRVCMLSIPLQSLDDIIHLPVNFDGLTRIRVESRGISWKGNLEPATQSTRLNLVESSSKPDQLISFG